MSDDQFKDGHAAEIYAGAGNVSEVTDVNTAEDGGEIDGTVEPASDDSGDDWGFEGRKRKLTREVLVGFAAIGVLVAVIAVVVAKSFFGNDEKDEKLASGPPPVAPPTQDGDPDEFLPPHSPDPNENVLSAAPGDGSFGGEPPPTDIPAVPAWPDPAPDRTVASVDPDEDLFGPSTPAPAPGNSTGEWMPGESPGTTPAAEPPSGLFDSQPVTSSEFPGTGGLPSPLDAPSGLPEPTYETASALPEPVNANVSRPGGTAVDPFAAEPPTDPLTGLPMPDPGGPNSAVTTIDPGYETGPGFDPGALPTPSASIPDLSTPVPPDSFVASDVGALPGPGFENSEPTYGQPNPGLGGTTSGFAAEPAAPIGALPDPGGYRPGSDPGALPVIEPFGPSPSIAVTNSGDGFESPVVSESNAYPGSLDQPGLVGTYNSSNSPNIGTIGLPSGGAAEQYTVQQGDSFWTISKKAYGSGRYWQKLADYNREQVPNPDRMRAGAVIAIPDPTVFGASTATAATGATALVEPVASIERANRIDSAASSTVAGRSDAGGIFFNPQGYPMYRIGGQDTLTTIAARHLGRASRWKQIYHMNREELQTPNKLQIDMVLQLPADASRVPLIARNSTFR